MKRISKAWFVFCLIFGISIHCFESKAQVSEKGIPLSFSLEQKKALLIPTLHLDSVPVKKLLEEDKKFRIENRYGIVQQCNIDLKKAGIKTEIKGVGTIWQYKIESVNACSIGLFFKNYHLPDKAKIFVYDSSGKRVRGAFTKRNNQAENSLPIAEFQGNNLIIEYFEPLAPEFSGEVVLGEISQAYIDLQKISESRIGINCPEGDDWKAEKHSVCLMTFHDQLSSYFCTGALINNVKEDETPYFLTANHCINSEIVAKTLITYFNYENSTCTSENASFSQTLSGATFKSGSNYSDFSLLVLNEYPPDEYSPFYAGWDISGNNPRSGACIHHPDGDPKSIAVAFNTAFSYPQKVEWYSEDLRLISTTLPDTHWNVLFDQGMPEAGSSGAPFFDQNKRIVGQLHGGVNKVLLFGKLSLSWDNKTAFDKQLAHWLDPTNSRTSLDGMWKMPPKVNFRSELQQVCINNPVLFTDKSRYRPTEWLWHVDPPTYSYANSTDSTSQNPQIVFHNDGAYSVKLVATNKYGQGELVQNQYILAQSRLDVQIQKSKRDSTVCGCDLKDFQLKAYGAVSYKFSVDKPELIDTAVISNTLTLNLRPFTNITSSFDTWIKVAGTNGTCMATDSILLHVIIQPNDNVSNAARLHYGRNTGYTNKCGTVEQNEPNPPSSGCLVAKSWCPDFKPGRGLLDNSVWFTFISPANGTVTINTSGFDDQIAIYEAETFQNLISGDKRQYVVKAANDNRSAVDRTARLENVVLDPGKQYWLQVDGNNAAFGDLIIDLESNALDAMVFPNPSNGIFRLNVFHPESGTAEISVCDLNGKVIILKNVQVNLNETQFNFNLAGHPKGVYILNIKLNGSVVTKKLVYI